MTDSFSPLSLQVRALDVRRGGRIVASAIDFSLDPGAALTLRGDNGTGKTSILRAVAGFSRPAQGAVEFLREGACVDPDEVRATALHWLGGGDGIADRLSVFENIRIWAGLLGGQAGTEDTFIEQASLTPVKNRMGGQLSTGQRRRLGLCRLLIAQRPIWLLDEPLSGLDPQGRALLQTAIDRHRERGGIALMASHEDGIRGVPVLRLQRMETS